jgi:hypothetical protein
MSGGSRPIHAPSCCRLQWQHVWGAAESRRRIAALSVGEQDLEHAHLSLAYGLLFELPTRKQAEV